MTNEKNDDLRRIADSLTGINEIMGSMLQDYEEAIFGIQNAIEILTERVTAIGVNINCLDLPTYGMQRECLYSIAESLIAISKKDFYNE